MTLKRREKRRYISLMHGCPSAEAAMVIEKRMQELYGTIVHERASLKVTRSGENVSVFRCTLGYERQLLVTIALAGKPVVTLDMSSSVRRIKKRLDIKVNTALLTKDGRG
jgi:hypothetical protein